VEVRLEGAPIGRRGGRLDARVQTAFQDTVHALPEVLYRPRSSTKRKDDEDAKRKRWGEGGGGGELNG
jgi:hypothetical protein